MADKGFLFTEKLTKCMLKLRFKNDRLFKTKKRPWSDFYNILLKNGFPPEISLAQVRKKWSYLWDTFKIAKKEKNKQWKYYRMLDKHFGKVKYKVLDKYESWSNNLRLKLIICVTEAKQHDMDDQTFWRTIESAMRCQDLPHDCCVLDLQGLWHHLKSTFLRKHRLRMKRPDAEFDWPPYDAMLEYYNRYSPEVLTEEPYIGLPKRHTTTDMEPYDNLPRKFHWTKDITESFIQIRLQNNWLFTQRPQAWKDFVLILRQHGFPNTLTSREACRKWSSTYLEYQKAKISHNKTWIYMDLFELYLGQGKMTINPLLDWQEMWVEKLIEARSSLEDFFLEILLSKRDITTCWREVEKKLRSDGIPSDHSLLNLPNMWSYLLRTYRWEKTLEDKGVSSERWPYYNEMKKYMELHKSREQKEKERRRREIKQEAREMKREVRDYEDAMDDDYEDDMNLVDLKQKLERFTSKNEVPAIQCRACAVPDACFDIFEHKDADDVDVATKLNIIAGVEVERTENLPTQICFNCLQELENAYRFRQKCQSVEKSLRESYKNIKLETGEYNCLRDVDDGTHSEDIDDITLTTDSANILKNDRTTIDIKMENGEYNEVLDDGGTQSDANMTDDVTKKTKKRIVTNKKPKKKYRYTYWKVCEICGVRTQNLNSHNDAHNSEKLYSCNICDKKFKFKNGLFLHKAVHEATPRKTCEICGKKFHVLSHYRKHFVHHANERKFPCETCGKRFNSSDILRVHARIHTDERPFACSECGKTFRTSGCVTRHKRIVHKIIRKPDDTL